MSDDDWVVSLPPINLHTVAPAYLLIAYDPPKPMTEEQVAACAKSVDLALWEAWRRGYTLSILNSRRRMN